MDNLVEIKSLVKTFSGNYAVSDFSYGLTRGKVLGLLGPNGSGKTTLMKILAGLLKSTKGKILIDSHEPGVYTKSIVSYLPDINPLYDWMTVKDAVKFYKKFFTDFDLQKSRELIQYFKINEDERVLKLSKGVVQKVLLMLVLSRSAQLYILDEPFNGVDAVGKEQIVHAILGSYSENSSVIISTHQMNELETVFDEVVFMENGKPVLSGNAEELRQSNGKSIEELYREVLGKC